MVNLQDKKNEIKHIFCDIDGTLTEAEKGCLNLDTIQYLKRLKTDRNINIVLVSGRGESATFFLSRDLGFQDKFQKTGYICENGGVVCTYNHEGLLQRTYLGDKIQLWQSIQKIISYQDFQILKSFSVYDKTRISDIIISKKCPLLQNDSFFKILSKKEIEITDSGSPDVHIHFKKISKGQGIRQYLLKRYQEEDPVFNFSKYLDSSIFCGNADNDIEAASTVGISIAVNNCSEGLAKVVDYISPKKYGEGVVQGIQHFLRNPEVNKNKK